MRVLLSCLVLVGLAVALPAEEKYTTKYDNIDVDEILKNDRLYDKYYKCLINQGTCTPDGQQLKDTIPDALKTGCNKCSEKQKAGAEKVLKYIFDKKQDHYKELEKLYDPDRVYRKKYEAEAEKRGIKIPS